LPQVAESSPDTSNTVVQESDPKPYQTTNTKAPVSNFSLSSIALKKAASKVVQRTIPEQEQPKDPFELEDLKALWKEYIDQLKKERKLNIASILSMNNIELENTDQILFTVANEMNKVEVNREMEQLLPFIRKRLNNFAIQIKLSVSENVKEETVYSPTEKYQYLLKLNPALEDLKNKFDLDF
jgi:DNA polymerase-3 subunit gamma/tau